MAEREPTNKLQGNQEPVHAKESRGSAARWTDDAPGSKKGSAKGRASSKAPGDKTAMADLPKNLQGNGVPLNAEVARRSEEHLADYARGANNGNNQGRLLSEPRGNKIANKPAMAGLTHKLSGKQVALHPKETRAREEHRAVYARGPKNGNNQGRLPPKPRDNVSALSRLRLCVKNGWTVGWNIVEAGVKKVIDTGKAFCCASGPFDVDAFVGDLPSPTKSKPTATLWAKTADMEILAAWYSETRNYGHPVVIIVDCSVTALAELIILLSEWSAVIPTVRILGVATTADVLQRLLPSYALSRLVPCAFTLKSPLGRLESVVRAVLADSFCAFEVSHMVFKHMHMHFLRHDLTVTSFIMSLKVACMEHFCSEPLSFVSQWLLRSSSQCRLTWKSNAPLCRLNSWNMREDFHLLKGVGLENMSNQTASGLWRFREQKQLWTVSLLVSSSREAGRCCIFRTLRPGPGSCEETAGIRNSAQRPSNRVLSSGWLSLVTKLRKQTPSILKSILGEWKRLTSAVNETRNNGICSNQPELH